MGCKEDDRLVTITSDHRRSVWYNNSGFTPSSEALGSLLKMKMKMKKKKKNMMTKIRKSRMSDFSCEETKVLCMDP